ncbi:MAG: excinuclease ABC subunit C, partial [Parcubacteria group bacterium Gr01-1014_70]
TWQEINTEIEALLLEASLIKKHLPPYNIVMRDDKQYLFVGFTEETFPRIMYTHQPISHEARNMKHETQEKRKKKFLEYIGPFTEASAVKKLLRALRKTFPYCTCKKPHTKMCQQAELGLCMDFCCRIGTEPSREQRASYLKNIRFIKNILVGRQKALITHLSSAMKSASKHQTPHAASASVLSGTHRGL